MGSTNQVTVTNGKWCVGTHSGAGIIGYRFEPFIPLPNRKYRRPACYGKIFPTQESATQFSVEHGFSQVYRSRPNGFIRLRLSPATRRYLKSIKDRNARWDALEKLLLGKHDQYFQMVRFKECGWKTRYEWDTYMDGDFKRLRMLLKGQISHTSSAHTN